MRARYLGDHSQVTLWGNDFPQGVFVEVAGELAQRKVAANSHFEVEASEEPQQQAPKRRGRPPKA